MEREDGNLYLCSPGDPGNQRKTFLRNSETCLTREMDRERERERGERGKQRQRETARWRDPACPPSLYIPLIRKHIHSLTHTICILYTHTQTHLHASKHAHLMYILQGGS